ncbi:FKBP-type peptidyl-prolyl cis-trans isomerase [Pelagicoccus sp. SDUM812002]|uniref:FKBP-type peptidyl-prolyl cis-trans isomerase n=1 Tax=Pelagicoccus sp. SDUM812002 TaxID=3041266 RepID=UPI00280ED8CD|nr:FKBP-type peptidyl-prolyl cis-trans isomerase [Pelagicoccus sp. SDUM812002]MDQ8185184.1 FKBP-type peptidyl-prolyl cis-trans isomerase [Pelagicoccus sp. SDUM812002]
MKKFLATAAFCALSVPVWGQLADMIDMPEGEDAEPNYSEEELLRSWGWLLAERFTLKDLDISAQELDWIAAGMMSHISGDDAPTDLSQSQLALQEYFSERELTIQQRQLEANRREGEEFFDSLFGRPDMLSLGTGLFYEIKDPGSDVRPTKSDTVVVHYEGRFLDNTVFDTSAGKLPIAFKLDEVIPAWTQGIPLIGEGGKIKLYVPSDLGYGDEGRPGIPPASTLVFEVNLIKVGLPDETTDSVEGADPVEDITFPSAPDSFSEEQ